ncbi:M15 family metallopeptidase [Thermoclostridium stercorarium]|uniref:M15 family metallopeptidase n=1 Tax=Thermoclostridium stercorarium TaxID=1510 RepID=UPI0022499D9F|nr:M15 family metallopeptidase [Thermoclostridium stercorarium]UZQ86607.1 M15 family metallopeptidase [Thermoclostridium stercorarium]
MEAGNTGKRLYKIVQIALIFLLTAAVCGIVKENRGSGDAKNEGNSRNYGQNAAVPDKREKTNPPAVPSGEQLTACSELSLYSGLPYFIEEYSERYIDYKRKNPDLPYEKVITYVNIGLDYDFYENVHVVEDGHEITVLVNKYNKLDDDFTPELTQLDQSVCVPGRGPQYLRREACEAFVKMHSDAKKLGLNITAYGTYRSIKKQHEIWNNAVKSGRTVEEVDSLNARGGHSEHHTGLAVDVIINDYAVEQTEEFKWYSENAHKYGFIIRYPKGKEHITGYKYEPWHLRYVGPEIAKEVYEKGITYDEYYVQAIQPAKNKNITKQKGSCKIKCRNI